MINMGLLWGAIALMLIIIINDVLKKYFEIDMDEINVETGIKKWRRIGRLLISKYMQRNKSTYIINRNTGEKSLRMVSAGDNKATVLATLRQITGIDYIQARSIINTTPAIFMTNISDVEAQMTKQALEFVGAKIEIR